MPYFYLSVLPYINLFVYGLLIDDYKRNLRINEQNKTDKTT